jgi:nucleoside-diphosphate-sugar epimerase
MNSLTHKVALTGSTGYLGGLVGMSLSKRGVDALHINRNLTKSQAKFGPNVFFVSAESSASELEAIFSKHEITSIVHTATFFTQLRTTEVLPQILKANFDFSVRVFEAAKAVGARFINFNSFWQRETHEYGLGPYAAVKEAFRHYLEVAAPVGMQICDIYVPDTFGPNDLRNKLIANMIQAKVLEKRYPIRNPDAEIDLSYGPFLAEFVSDLILENAVFFRRAAYINYENVHIGRLQSLISEVIFSSEVIEPEYDGSLLQRRQTLSEPQSALHRFGALPNSSLEESLKYTVAMNLGSTLS